MVILINCRKPGGEAIHYIFKQSFLIITFLQAMYYIFANKFSKDASKFYSYKTASVSKFENPATL
jgi:hypothetical protein